MKIKMNIYNLKNIKNDNKEINNNKEEIDKFE